MKQDLTKYFWDICKVVGDTPFPSKHYPKDAIVRKTSPKYSGLFEELYKILLHTISS